MFTKVFNSNAFLGLDKGLKTLLREDTFKKLKLLNPTEKWNFVYFQKQCLP